MAVVAFLAASGGYYVARALSTDDSAPRGMEVPVSEDLLGQSRPDFTLSNLDGVQVSASDFDGRIWLVNFWATWCKPCVDEMPMLSQLYSELNGQGVTFVGIALDDQERATRFVEDLSIQYPILVGQTDVVLAGRRYGNSTGLLPFSVLVDGDGIIRWTHLGALDRDELLRQIDQLR